ncbi:Lacal_2735 family protein [Salegentibacter maritimus]|uniref:Lacal_2735 family protein n=1 Tax=Salegentibacter maritimus TaxID=2794347 RepID=A0ABS0TG86_9FLAO|nr:Lacal_2735 family protein [Salegentibacter maritimus]MBI6119652.1 Lacal_2735 family protein [Salegentibacter maritimus]
MFRLFRKKSKVEKLEVKYKKLLEEAHQLSTTNRSKSDEKMYEANEVLEEIEEIRK